MMSSCISVKLWNSSTAKAAGSCALGAAARLRGGHDEHGAQSFATQRHQIADRRVEFGVRIALEEIITPRLEGEPVLGHGRLGIEGLGHQSPRSSCWWMYWP